MLRHRKSCSLDGDENGENAAALSKNKEHHSPIRRSTRIREQNERASKPTCVNVVKKDARKPKEKCLIKEIEKSNYSKSKAIKKRLCQHKETLKENEMSTKIVKKPTNVKTKAYQTKAISKVSTRTHTRKPADKDFLSSESSCRKKTNITTDNDIKIEAMPSEICPIKINVESSCDTKKTLKRVSSSQGWARVYDKYSPSTEINLSPIKCTQGNLRGQMHDKCVEIFLWTVNMSELHYYDNAFVLLNHSKNDHKRMSLMLHRACIGTDMVFFNSLDEVTLLGEGTFGSVYSCRDPRLNVKYAVKHILGSYKKNLDHFQTLLTYMAERDANIRAMDSPFIAKFCYSLQIQSTGDFFLFFEFCIGDLEKYIKEISMPDITLVSQALSDNMVDIVNILFESMNAFLEINFIYIFEIFCGLDFLVQCNIVHQDIKPGNIMISNSLHLKIGDFGVAYRTRTIHRYTNVFLLHKSKLETMDKRNYLTAIDGTVLYHDIELQSMILKMNDPEGFEEVFNDPTKYDVNGIVINPEELHPSFIVDTWAAGVICIQLLFRGYMITSSDDMDDLVYPDLDRQSISLFIVQLFAQKQIYEQYIHNGLQIAGGQGNEELMEFIASIFKPRSTRCSSFIKEKELHIFSKRAKMKYVDIEKVEKLETFSSRNFNRSSVHLRSINESMRHFFPVPKLDTNTRFETLLKNIETLRSGKRLINFNPGVTINFF